jgi:fatty acid-binding protein DegV
MRKPAAWRLAAAARKRFTPDELFITELTPVLGLHSGPDALGLAYCSGI